MENNVLDKLLYYLSHQGEVTWPKFKEAIDRLTGDRQPLGSPSTYLKSLARFGHLDFDPTDLSRVVIAPPVLIDTAVEGRYVLVGSRTPGFLGEVKSCVSRTGGKWSVRTDRYAATTIVLEDLTDESLAEIEGLGIHISPAFSAKLAMLLPKPKYDLFPVHTETTFPDSTQRFNLEKLVYEPANEQRVEGLYEISRYGSNAYVLKFGLDQREVPRDWGEWRALYFAKRKGFISYREQTQVWRFRFKLHLPLIIDRCATLCSGYPPKLAGNYMCYTNVPIGIAHRITTSLYQEWEID